MIKVMNLVAILIAPSTVLLKGEPAGWVLTFIALAVLTGAILFSKRGGVTHTDDDIGAVQRQPAKVTERSH